MNEPMIVKQPTARMLYHLGRKGAISAEQQQIGVETVGGIATSSQWHNFAHQLLLILGLLTAPLGFLYMLSHWNEINHLHKIGGAGFLVVSALCVTTLFGLDHLKGKLSLSTATFLLGILLALIGDAYSPDSDLYRLFATWTVMAIGWVIIGRFAPLWAGWQLLLTSTLGLLFANEYGMGSESYLLAPVLVGSLAIPAWHLTIKKKWLGTHFQEWPELVTVALTLICGTIGTALFFLSDFNTPLFSSDVPLSLRILLPIAILNTVGVTIWYHKFSPQRDYFWLGCLSGGLMFFASMIRLFNDQFEFLIYIGLGVGVILLSTVVTKMVKEKIDNPSIIQPIPDVPQGELTDENS